MKPFDPFSIVIAVNHLTDAVNEATQTNIFKDYAMPIIVVALSALTAYFIAIRGYQYQESYKNEKAKADTLNHIILKMQGMQANLIATKQNYFNKLETNPIQRAVNVPPMSASFEYESINLNELTQLLYAKKRDIEKYPWFNISSFVATIGNYNQFIELVRYRNELDKEVKPLLAPLMATGGKIHVTLIAHAMGPMLTMRYVDITEKLITIIDDLLITTNDFMFNFSAMAAESLNKKYLKNYIYLQGYQNNSENFYEIVKRCVEVDMVDLANLMQLDHDEALIVYKENSVVITTPKD
ncbi:hypothetical protein ACR3BZ_000023 [Enterobacter hormaechei]|uniref:hypothetical protein n=2 Tax=Enterobacter cloacae complex TaxID=354276 RepID=UPI001255DACD|nr:hypothetical protein [Enterobacter hormaechei]VAC85699.1 Uncharacterised protein [Enterobacter cloacae]VAM09225.1 Uncharacterised protein [Enterobacter kobei]MBK4612292.1 hypothetical protein [Enterobacter hormaechei]MCF2345578.1 hypothetical protein [Enterobacter hormaechei]MCF2372736.1 hypothetical protein [Enterobacter hormaechei]